LLVKHRLQKPLIINAHGGDVLNNSKLSSFIQKLVVPIIMNADLIVVPSDYFQGVVHNKYLLDKDKIFVSPSSGIDKNLFNPNKGQTTETLTIGFVSRIDKGKGWDIFLDAISILTHRNLQFKVLMIGKGEEEKELIEKVEKLNLNFVVDYIGAKKHDELPEYFNQMDLFVFPTMLNESLGLVGLEAMACGVPVVGSNIGGLPGYIEDKVNGILFEAGNKKELANQIEYILKMRIDELNRYKNNALKTSSAYDARKVTQNLSKKLFELANRCI
jgi:glycosyltransferase involved in cell wall biosynthesis